ncbi:MAG: WcaF family extracellular polysaccharide biosynthesis acetyltransferase [Candidatus Omnitrophota bacterium]
MNKVSLKNFRKDKKIRERNLFTEVLWQLFSLLLFKNSLFVFFVPKRFILKLFGAKVGKGVIIKPCVNIKYPWKLKIGDYSWIGEEVWIDNLASVAIDRNVCISQGAYVCTGNHNWKKPRFDLERESVTIEEGVWVGTKAIVSPGVILKSHSVITAGSVVTADTESYMVYQGNPAKSVRKRIIG